ncbi:MAG: tRNA pseudouridine(55) synthase TruB [Lachnospiraceae bacterium]
MIHGILNVYKEKGYTSHDVVAKLRRITGQKKIGHTGTLDPDAVGVLPVCLGKATKLCDLLTDKDKTYEAVLLLGESTDTQDISGKIISKKDTSKLTESDVREAVLAFEGEYDQIPPMYSALKVNGKKLYELAREGKTVERRSRKVMIYGIQILSVDLPKVRMSVSCSKGTYIRTLCHDIGEKLGCGGCMESLVRTCVGRFCIEDSMTLDVIEQRMKEETLGDYIVSVDEMFPDCPKVFVAGKGETGARNGGILPEDTVHREEDLPDGQNVRLYDERGHFIALYQWKECSREYHLIKMFFPEI